MSIAELKYYTSSDRTPGSHEKPAGRSRNSRRDVETEALLPRTCPASSSPSVFRAHSSAISPFFSRRTVGPPSKSVLPEFILRILSMSPSPLFVDGTKLFPLAPVWFVSNGHMEGSPREGMVETSSEGSREVVACLEGPRRKG